MRTLRTLLSLCLIFLSLAWVFELPSHLGLALFSEQLIALALGIAIALVFLAKPLGGKQANPFDISAALISLTALVYLAVNYERLIREFVRHSPEIIILGSIVAVSVVEAVRRVAGRFMLLVILTLLTYALIGHLIPAPLTAREVSLFHLVAYLGFDPSAIIGSLLNITITVVVPFVLLGNVLVSCGGGDFFTRLANAAVGNRRGAAAKVSILSSALFGSVSGSAVSNVATTGAVTIPLMRRSGLSAEHAAAIEVSASTGGQLMPPIMGAAAFLMAEFLEIPYTQVILSGLIPVFLYYLAIFTHIDVWTRTQAMPLEGTPMQISSTLREGWHFAATVVLLVVLLFGFRVAPEKAAIWAVGVIAFAAVARRYRGRRLTVREALRAVSGAGLSAADLIVLVAAAGLVVGVLNATGGGFALTLLLVQLAGVHTFTLLAVAGLTCVVFGMGMPTTGVYVLLSVLVAPALVESGFDLLAAHFFVLYMGMMSMITPPLGLATFPASVISGADSTRIGLCAIRLSWVAYLVPFLFLVSPTLIMQGPTTSIIIDAATATCGVVLISRSMGTAACGAEMRALFLLLGVLALLPESMLGKAITLSASLAGVWALFRSRRSSASSGDEKTSALL